MATTAPRAAAPFAPTAIPSAGETLGGLPLDPVYTEGDEPRKEHPVPGAYPYERGIHSTMYRDKLWTMRQFAGFGTAADTNERYRFLLESGQSGLSVAFDMPTLMGYDSDAPESLGEVGRCGVAIDTIEDMARLFEGIDQGTVTTSMTINSPAPILLAQYLCVAKERKVPLERIGGTLQNDILKEYIAQKEFIFPLGPSMRLVTDIIAYCTEHLPRWHPVSVSGYHIREAGSTAAQELAFTLADGFAYVEAAIERGLNVDDFAPRLSFFFNSHIDFFEEIAKYRAARRIYARRMRDIYGAKSEKSWKLRFHTQTAGCSLTGEQIEINVARTAFEAMAAVLGGTNSLHTNSMDEVLALPTEKAVQIALRTQQILAYETGVASVADPLGGSWFVEALTDKMEEEVERYFDEIQERGGMVAAVAEGYPQREIADAAFHYQRQLEDHDRIFIGVNAFREETKEAAPSILVIDPQVEKDQVASLRKVKQQRDSGAVDNRLEALATGARGTDNLMPLIMEAVSMRATEGEIISTLRDVFGVHHESPVF